MHWWALSIEHIKTSLSWDHDPTPHVWKKTKKIHDDDHDPLKIHDDDHDPLNIQEYTGRSHDDDHDPSPDPAKE